MTLAPPLLANAELVCLAWIRDVVTAYDLGLGTTLQGPNPDTGVLSWGSTGFVTVYVAGGGNVHVTVPLRQTVLNVSCYATNERGGKPPWGRANAIAEVIVAAGRSLTWGATMRPVQLPPGYPVVRVGDGEFMTEPRRMQSDAANYARYDLELMISWLAL